MRSGTLLIALAAVTASCRANDEGNCIVTTVAIAGAPATLNQGNTATLTPQVTGSSCGGLQNVWTSSADSILHVDQHGVLTAVLPGGPVTITLIAGTMKATATISVVILPVATVTVTPDSLLISIGGTYQLGSILTAADSTVIASRPVTWATTTSGVAVVGNNGLLTGLARGMTTVTATSEGHIGAAKVFVAAPRLVYLWNDLFDVGLTATPDSNYSFGIGGTAVTVTSPSAGLYNVGYSGFARAGAETDAFFVTQNGGTDGGFCSVSTWSDFSAAVRCVDKTGAVSPTPFDLVGIGSATLSGRFAYAWSNDPTPSVPYAAASGYRYSSSGKPILISRTAVGAYSVVFTGQGRVRAGDREGLVVSSYGNSGTSCQLADWTTTVATDLTASVRCFSATGVVADAPFTIALVSDARNGGRVAFADANLPGTVSYVPVNSAVKPTGVVTVIRFGPGDYHVRLDGLIRTDSLRESFLVTTVGTTPVRCHIAQGGWIYDLNGATVGVTCATAAGAAIDSRFEIVGLQ